MCTFFLLYPNIKMKSFRSYSIHYPDLLRTGIPIMVGQLGTIVMGFADTIMVGWYGTEELAAAGFVNNILALAFIAAMGFSYGLTPIVSSLHGEGKNHLIAQKLKNSLLANNILSLLFMACLALLYLNLHRIGLPEELLPLMRPYFAVITVSILPQMAFNAFKQFSDGIQDTRMPMWIMLISNVLNIILNWLLIFGKFGFPEWGLMGAGVATLASRIFQWAAISLTFHLTSRYGEHPQYFKKASPNITGLKEVSQMGWPIALQMGMESASFNLSAIYIGWLGTIALAANQIMITIGQLCFMLYYGMAAAVAVLVSYYRGAGQTEQTRHVAVAGLHLTWGIGILVCIPIFLLRHQLGYWFTDSAEVAQLISILVYPLLVYQFGDGLQCIYSNALRGMADVRPMVWIAFVAYFLISLPLGYIFGFVCNWQMTGIWLAYPFGLTSAGLMYYLRFIHTHKKLQKSIHYGT